MGVCILFGETARANYRLLPALASKAALQVMPFKVPTPLSQASVEKRSSEGGSQQQAKKAKSLPPLGDLVAMESAPKRAGAQRLRPPSPESPRCQFVCETSGAMVHRNKKNKGFLQWRP